MQVIHRSVANNLTSIKTFNVVDFSRNDDVGGEKKGSAITISVPT